jgi:hypothetical protein
MGNPTYTQVYTDAIRKFNLVDNGTTITITHLPTITDAINLHRRDYNAVPQILPNGAEGITAFSGVFQPTVDLPFLNCVNIDSTTYMVNNSFQQYYNHYHCAVVPLYSAANNEMHNVFFGGIAQFYDNLGVLVQDNNVPFVKTIARVTRNSSGTMAEYKLPVEMPSLMGTGAEFIPIKTVPHFSNEVLKLDEFTADSTLVGYIYGGISSTAANIFFSNTGTESTASNIIYKVFVIKSIGTVPVSISNFSASKKQGYNQLQWTLGNFSSTDTLEVQYSLDGSVFEKAFSVPVNTSNSYTVKDSGYWIGNNIIYYRLKSIESGGGYVLSRTVKLINDYPNTINLSVFPNPNNGNFVVKFYLNKISETSISLYNINGKKIEETVLNNLQIGENTFQRKIKNLDLKGTYILTIETPHEKASQKIIIEQ